MARQFEIHIPQSQVPSILRFLDISHDDLRAMVECIVSAPCFPDVEDLGEYCNSKVGISADEAEDVITIAINLSRLKRSADLSIVSVLSAIPNSLRQRNAWSDEREKQWNERSPLLANLLATDGVIEIMAKTRELLSECQTVLIDSAVITDVRHVYNSDASKILAGVLLYTLSLDVVEGRDQIQQVHVTISNKDIDKLISQLQRCKKKARVATELLAEAALPELTPKREVQK